MAARLWVSVGVMSVIERESVEVMDQERELERNGLRPDAALAFRGKVYKTTADRIIADRQLVCSYAKPRFEALPDGRMVIINGKVCTEVSRGK